MRIFVTGGTGFIGSNLLKKLLLQGNEVLALTRHENTDFPDGVKPVIGSLNSLQRYIPTLEGCDACIHLAAIVSFDPEAENELIQTNYQGTLELLDACRKAKIKRFLFVSSACTIGLSRNGDILDEATSFDTSLLDHNIYLKSKKLTEEKIETERYDDIEIITVNPTTVYGHGDYSLNSGTLIKKVVCSPFVPVPPGGTNVVDVDDVSKGIVAALKNGKHKERYILGGHNLTFREIVHTVAATSGTKTTFVPIPSFMRGLAVLAIKIMGMVREDRLLQPQIIDDIFSYKYYSSAKAKRELDWKAEKSFSRSVSEAIDFYKANGLI